MATDLDPRGSDTTCGLSLDLTVLENEEQRQCFVLRAKLAAFLSSFSPFIQQGNDRASSHDAHNRRAIPRPGTRDHNARIGSKLNQKSSYQKCRKIADA
jgi:cystathionine beta-lyase/cystathionine gamma-synthase